MLGKSHLIVHTGSLALGLLIVNNLDATSELASLVYDFFIDDFNWKGSILEKASYIGASFLGTLLPDIDSEKSMLGKYFHLPFEHRTWTHSIWPIILLCLLGWSWPGFYWVAFGYFTHLFWDSFSYGGICWLYPMSDYRRYGSGAKVKKGFSPKIYRTGSVSEKVLVAIFTMVVVMVYILYYDF